MNAFPELPGADGVLGRRRIMLDGRAWEAVHEDGTLLLADGRRVDEEAAVHLPPCEPSKIIGVHVNYRSRAEELAVPLPPAPTYFEKPVTAVNAHRGRVVRPGGCRYLNYEGEIAIVIGRPARNVTQAEAPAHIAGYTVANDFTLHDFLESDMVRAKGADSLAPLGPTLVTGWDFAGKTIRTYVNGRVVQEDTADGMVWDMHYLVADLSRMMTLLPGDVIMSGTPANSRPVQPGDTVSVEVDGIGTLTNDIVEVPVTGLGQLGTQPSDSRLVRAVALLEEQPGKLMAHT
jgi:5-oxopent-3-ene-1,2,5-tricarboxylate decarboxylase / 2-hydroxyhepta-2,4-diene-1,7-dioate isomerase